MKVYWVGIICLMFSFVSTSSAINFNGDGDGTSWEDPDNWDLDRVPISTDNIGNVGGKDVVLSTAAEVVGIQNSGLTGGSLLVNSNVVLTVGSSGVEIVRKGVAGTTGTLTVDGGTVTIGGTLLVVHYIDQGPTVGTLDVKNGGSVTCNAFRNGDGTGQASTMAILLSGDTSSITTLSGNNSYANGGGMITNKFEMSGGTFTTAGRDFWGGQVNMTLSGGTYDQNSDQIHLGVRDEGATRITLSGGTLDCAGTVYLNGGSNTTAQVVQTDGVFRMITAGRDFLMSSGTYSGSSSYTISGGELDLIRNLSMNKTHGSTFSVIGTNATINIAGTLYADNAASTLEFKPVGSGISAINCGANANINGATLNVDLSEFDFETSTLILIDCANLSGTFGTVNIIGEDCSADVVYDTVNDELRLENISGPSRGTLIIVQ